MQGEINEVDWEDDDERDEARRAAVARHFPIGTSFQYLEVDCVVVGQWYRDEDGEAQVGLVVRYVDKHGQLRIETLRTAETFALVANRIADVPSPIVAGVER